MKLAWVTDPHINFVSERRKASFYSELAEHSCDAVVITGDIAEASDIVPVLAEMSQQVGKPIYFVLGNHDYYGDSVAATRVAMVELMKEFPNLYWMPASGAKQLSDQVMMVGVDGWADGRLGNYQETTLVMNDSVYISDLRAANDKGRDCLLEKMQQLADADAKLLRRHLEEAIQAKPKKIIVLTHVPPFKEACYYRGKISGDDGLPFFASKATGEVLREIAESNPYIEFEVFCGHTHHLANFHPLTNVSVRTGQADYGRPVIQYTINAVAASKYPNLFNRLHGVKRVQADNMPPAPPSPR